MDALLFLLLVGVAALIIRAIVLHRKKVEDAWRTAAAELGLAFQPTGLLGRPSLRGEVEGCPVVVDIHRRHSGKHSESFTRYVVRCPSSLGLGLRLRREGVLSGLAKLFGTQDIRVGDASFDDAVLVKGAEPRAVAAFLTPSRRMRILRFFEAFRDGEINDDGVSVRRRGTETDPRRIVAAVRRLVRTARGIRGGAGADATMDAALMARREGRLDEAVTLARRAAEQDPATGSEARRLEGDLLYAGGRYEEASEAYADAGRADPGDLELPSLAEHARRRVKAAGAAVPGLAIPVAVAGNAASSVADGEGIETGMAPGSQAASASSPVAPYGLDAAGDPAPSPEDAPVSDAPTTREGEAASPSRRPPESEPGSPSATPPGAEEAPAPAPSPGTETVASRHPSLRPTASGPASAPPAPPALDAAVVCQDLFQGDPLSLQVSQRFEERYRGRQVRWTGVLRQVRAYAFDLVFGPEPGTRLVLDLHEVSTGVFGRMVQAVVRLPRTALEAMEPRVGEEVTFAGRLVACDAFMRNLILAEGRVLD